MNLPSSAGVPPNVTKIWSSIFGAGRGLQSAELDRGKRLEIHERVSKVRTFPRGIMNTPFLSAKGASSLSPGLGIHAQTVNGPTGC